MDAPPTSSAPKSHRPFWTKAALVAVAVHLTACLISYGGLLSSSQVGDVPHYHDFATLIVDQHRVPYRDFYIEFPPGALPAFVAPELIDGHRYALFFKLVMALCGALTLVVGARILSVLGASRRRYLSLAPFALLPLLLGHVYLNRYDAWPALLLVSALLALLLGRERGALFALGLAVAAKLFPAAMLPIAAARALQARGRRGLVWAMVAFVGAMLFVFGPFLAIAPGGIGFSLQTQAERHLQIESLGASVLLGLDRAGLYDSHWIFGAPGSLDLDGSLPNLLGGLSSIAQLAAVAFVTLVYWRGTASDERLVSACAAAITITAFGKVLSPQYLTMLAAIVPLVGGRSGRRATMLLVLALIATQILSTWGNYHDLRNAGWSVVILLGRNACLVGLFALIVAGMRHKPITDRVV